MVSRTFFWRMVRLFASRRGVRCSVVIVNASSRSSPVARACRKLSVRADVVNTTPHNPHLSRQRHYFQRFVRTDLDTCRRKVLEIRYALRTHVRKMRSNNRHLFECGPPGPIGQANSEERQRHGKHCSLGPAPPSNRSASTTLPAPQPALAPLRLTRRGKFVLIALPIFLVSAAALMLLGMFQSPANASDRTPAGVDALDRHSHRG